MAAFLIPIGIGLAAGAAIGGGAKAAKEIVVDKWLDDDPNNDKFDWGNVAQGAVIGGAVGGTVGAGYAGAAAGAAKGVAAAGAAEGAAASPGATGALGSQFLAYQVGQTQGQMRGRQTGYASSSVPEFPADTSWDSRGYVG